MASDKPVTLPPRALGKVILVGEHAVVHGHRALAGAIDRGLRCTTSLRNDGTTRLRVPAWDLDVDATDEHPVARALTIMLEAAGRRDLHLEIESDLFAAAGLGSSAALCVAIARALRPELTGAELRELANLGECCFHERPSGIDVALSCSGGFGVYERGKGLTPLSCPPLSIVVGLSGVPRSTAAMVGGVAERMQTSAEVRSSIAEIGALSASAQAALVAGDFPQLGASMNQCHRHLQTIGVSLEVLDRMVESARGAGAIGAKLTGAGGGGSIIALAPHKEEAVMKALADLGHQSFSTTLGAMA